MKTGRNAPCPCGSGKKYKRCCLVKEAEKADFRSKALLAIIGLAVILGGVMVVTQFWGADSASALSQRVWSEEHGHWHTVSPTGSGSATRPITQPGPAPPGRVWSSSHGHWHTAPNASTDAARTPR